jgi:DNA modification methylase
MSGALPLEDPVPRNVVLVDDALQQLRKLPGGSIDMVMTSPPYFRLRDYQVDGQLGMETHVEEWVNQLREVMGEVARVLVPTGSVWLNLGDTYSTHVAQGAVKKSLLLAPERLARALVADGWCVRNKIVWAKSNPMPTSVRDRFACTWEVIYFLVRSPSYFFDLDAVRVPHRSVAHRPAGHEPREALPESWRGPNSDGAGGLVALKREGRVGHPLGKNPGDVWDLPTAGYRGAHFATYPIRLVERAIRAGCPVRRCARCRAPWTTARPAPGAAVGNGRGSGSGVTDQGLMSSCDCNEGIEPGLVLDPFLGAGTTGLVAEELGRDWLGIELNPDFARLSAERIATARQQRNDQEHQGRTA